MSAEVNINERLIMAQLRLMASIFCPLFSFDGGSIKVGHVPDGRTHKVGITKQGKILIFGFYLQRFGDYFCLVVFVSVLQCFIKTQRNDKKFMFNSINIDFFFFLILQFHTTRKRQDYTIIFYFHNRLIAAQMGLTLLVRALYRP